MPVTPRAERARGRPQRYRGSCRIRLELEGPSLFPPGNGTLTLAERGRIQVGRPEIVLQEN
jgi:hypothetical protein